MKALFKIIALFSFCLIGNIFSANYTVTSSADSGAGSLREAVASASANPICPGNNVTFTVTTDNNFGQYLLILS